MEKFKSIKGFEGLYSVGSEGTMISEQRIASDGRMVFKKILGPRYSRSGYKRCTLRKNGKSYDFLVHRLVAEYFVANQDNKPEVNHMNCEKGDNFANNLEWVTRHEQMSHAGKNGLLGPFKRIL